MTYLDNDRLNKPVTGDAPVYALEGPGPVSVTQLINRHPKMFGPGIGLLKGKYSIVLDQQVPPAPRYVPVPLREVFRETLDLVQQDIIAPVQEPTPWISSVD